MCVCECVRVYTNNLRCFKYISEVIVNNVVYPVSISVTKDTTPRLNEQSYFFFFFCTSLSSVVPYMTVATTQTTVVYSNWCDWRFAKQARLLWGNFDKLVFISDAVYILCPVNYMKCITYMRRSMRDTV